MARTKQQIEATKQVLNASLGRVIDEYHTIDAQMSELPHDRRGTAHQSLDRRTYVLRGINGITVDFRDTDGQSYSIQIHRS